MGGLDFELATPSRDGGGIKGLFGTGPRRRAKLSELYHHIW
jgi:hypothetical protein